MGIAKSIGRGLIYLSVFMIGYYIGAGGCQGKKYDINPPRIEQSELEKKLE